MRPRSRAFSLVEVVIVISVMAVLATLAVVTMSRVVGASRGQKMSSDTETLNRAVAAYVASGGDLGSVTDPQEVLATLKQQAASGTRTVGLAGAVIDPRIQFILQTPEEAQSGADRIVWNPAQSRFEVVAGGGPPGIASFAFADLPDAPAEASDRSGPVLYAKDSSWIWDYQEAPAGTGPAPSEMPVSQTPNTTPPPAPPAPVVSTTALAAPVLSIPSGSYPYGSFNLNLSISDPNPAGSGVLYYSVDYGNWKPYTGSFTVAPGSVVNAQVLPATEAYTSSPTVEGNYQVQRQQLVTPSIELTSSEFNDSVDVIGVRIADPNPSGTAALAYVLTEPGVPPPPRSTWPLYAGQFSVSSSSYPAGFDVHAYARAVNTVSHTDSGTAKRSAGASFIFSDPGAGRVLYIIDASGSMRTAVGSTTRFGLVLDSLIGAITRLRSTTSFSVVTFAGDIVWSPGTWTYLPANTANKAAMATSIAGFSLAGGTNYEAGLGAAMRYAPLPERVFFLTDGEPTQGDYTGVVSQLSAAGVKVNTIGVDLTDGGKVRLDDIAKQTMGKATTVSTR